MHMVAVYLLLLLWLGFVGLCLQSVLLLFFFANTCSIEAVLPEVSHMHCFCTVVNPIHSNTCFGLGKVENQRLQ
jgi:hypothetical protein